MNHAMPSCLASHRICELYRAIFFFHNVFHLSTMFIHSSTLPVHQPFELVMGKSGVKTRYSEQTMLPAEAYILLVIDSSSEEDSEADDQSYYPPEVYAQTWQGYITHVIHVVLHCLVLHHIWIAICLLAYYINHIFELYHAMMFT